MSTIFDLKFFHLFSKNIQLRRLLCTIIGAVIFIGEG